MSDEDEFITMGESFQASADEVALSGRGVNFSAHGILLEFDVPPGKHWLPGVYQSSDSSVYPQVYVPVIAHSPGKACSTMSGSLTVHEAEFDHLGVPVRISLDFVHRCENTPPRLAGAVRFHANGVDDVPAGDPDDCAVNLPTGLCVSSQSHDVIGHGQTMSFSPTDGDFSIRTDGDVIIVRFSTPDVWWALSFAAKSGDPLQVMAYENASAPQSLPRTVPDLDVSASGACSQRWGRFVVHEISLLTDGGPSSFSADFEQHCGAADAPALFGKVRINATKP